MEYVSVINYLGTDAKLEDLPDEHVRNVNTLVPKINEFLEAFGSYREIASGYRTKAHHERVYAEINTKRAKQKLPLVSIPWGSKHLVGAAIDLEDKDAKLYNFTRANVKLLESLGLWCEERQGGWLHVQCYPPKSGKRFFIP